MIRNEAARAMPEIAPLNLPKRKWLPSLGTTAPDAALMDDAQMSKEDSFRERAIRLRDDREDNGVGDGCGLIQPWVAPDVDDTLVGARLEVCFECNLDDGGQELRWCVGKVMSVKNEKKVLMKWMANKEHGEEATISNQRLLKTKWNPLDKHTSGGWRLADL